MTEPAKKEFDPKRCFKIDWKDGVIDLRLTIPGTVLLTHTAAVLAKVATITPVRKEVAEQLATCVAALPAFNSLVELIGCDAEEVLPLLDGQVQPGPASTDANPPAAEEDVPFGTPVHRKKN